MQCGCGRIRLSSRFITIFSDVSGYGFRHTDDPTSGAEARRWMICRDGMPCGHTLARSEFAHGSERQKAQFFEPGLYYLNLESFTGLLDGTEAHGGHSAGASGVGMSGFRMGGFVQGCNLLQFT